MRFLLLLSPPQEMVALFIFFQDNKLGACQQRVRLVKGMLRLTTENHTFQLLIHPSIYPRRKVPGKTPNTHPHTVPCFKKLARQEGAFSIQFKQVSLGGKKCGNILSTFNIQQLPFTGHLSIARQVFQPL